MPSSPAKVLHYVASLRGGAAVCALQLARRLPALGFDCVVAAPFDNPALAGQEDALGARLHACANRAALTRILNQEQPALLHCHGHRAAMAGRWVHSDAKRVVTYHGFHVPHYRTALARTLGTWWERWALRRTDLVICVSEEDRRVAEDWLKSSGRPSIPPFHVVYNGIDVARFQEGRRRPAARAELGLSEGDFVVGYVGRYHRQKSPGTLLEAIAGIRGSLPAARLLMIGDGPLEADLRRQAERLGLAGRVVFFPPQNDLARLYACLDVFALPSRWEGLPLVLLEAGAAGVPVVASDAPGNREVVAHENTGLLFRPGDPQDAGRAILRLARDALLAQRCAAALSRRVEEKFTVERMVRDTAALYRAVL